MGYVVSLQGYEFLLFNLEKIEQHLTTVVYFRFNELIVAAFINRVDKTVSFDLAK